MATQQEVAAHLGVSQSAVSTMARDGTIPTTGGRGGYDLDHCRVAYVEHLRGIAAGRDSSRPGSLEAERARLAAAQAELAERRNARERRELASLPDVTAALTAFVELVKRRLGQVGAEVAGGDHALRRRIDQAIVDAQEDLSAARVIAQTTGDEPFNDDSEEAAVSRSCRRAGASDLS